MSRRWDICHQGFGGAFIGIENVSDLTIRGVTEAENRKKSVEIRMSRNRESGALSWCFHVDAEVIEDDKSTWLKKMLSKDLKT